MKLNLANIRRRWRWLPRKTLPALLLLALTGFAVYSILATIVWPAHHRREAEKALDRRDLEAARRHLDGCLKAWPASVPVRLLAARTARLAERYDEAEQHLSLCQRLEATSGEAVQLERDLILTQRGGLARMSALSQLVENGHPDSPLILEAMAAGWRWNCRFGYARRCLNLWLESQPNSVPALTRRGSLLEAMEQFPEAARDYGRVVEELDPTNDAVRKLLANCLLSALNRLDEAEKHFAILRQRRPDDVQVLWGLASCRRQMGRPAEAQQLLEELLAGDPANLRALTELGRVALDLDQPETAERWLREAVKVRPTDYQANFWLSQCLRQTGKTGEARRFAERADQVKKDIDRLDEIIKQAMPTNPRGPELRYEAAMIFLRLGNDGDALRWLDNALREDPRHAPTHQALADYFRRIGKPDRAEQHRRLAEENAMASRPKPAPP